MDKPFACHGYKKTTNDSVSAEIGNDLELVPNVKAIES